jgi:hypothetical protein
MGALLTLTVTIRPIREALAGHSVLRVAIIVAVGVASYAAFARLQRQEELGELLSSRKGGAA